MGRIRDRVTLGAALAVVVLSVMGQPPLFVSIPLLLLALFLIIWGRAPRGTEAVIASLPGSRYILRGLRELDAIISPQQTLSQAQEQHVRSTFEALNATQKVALRRLVITGQARNIPDQDWQTLEAAGFVERDFVGPKGIKHELKPVLGLLLDEYESGQRKQVIDELSTLLQEGTMIFQRKVSTDEEYSKWKTDMDRWVDRVATILRESFGKSEETLFMMLEPVIAADVKGHYDDPHNTELLHLDARLRKLSRFIEKHS